MEELTGSFLRKIIVLLFLVAASVMVFPGFSGCLEAAGSQKKEELVSKFILFDNAVNNGQGYSAEDNAEGKLAWGESYLLDAYLTMYEATQDTKWIDKFIVQGKRVIASTDKSRGIKDYKGRSLFGWSSLIYSPPYGWKPGDKIQKDVKNKPWIMFWGHTGMIAYPFAKFAVLVKEREGLSRYKDEKINFQKAAEEAVAVFDKNWRFDAKTGEGFFVADKDEPARGNLRQPLDRDLAMGRVYIQLCNLTGKSDYCDKARALAIMFKNRLVVDGDRFIWNILGTTKEDLSHGAIDVSFACESFSAGLIFTKEDMSRFGRTLLKARQQDRFSQYVDGTGDDDALNTYSVSSARWLDLSRTDCTTYKTVHDFMVDYLKSKKKVNLPILLGIANLVKYWDSCGAPLSN